MHRSTPFRIVLAVLALLATACAADNSPQPPPAKGARLSPQERLLLIRGLQSEFIFVRRLLPVSKEGAIVKNGRVTPNEDEIRHVAANKGIAAKPGDKAQITALDIQDDKIVFEINGGPKKKGHWYDHVQLGAGGVGPQGQPSQQPQQDQLDGNLAHGCLVTLAFNGLVPSLTVDQVKQLLLPVFAFNAKTSAEALIDKLPPIVQQALKSHKVLVGMNRELVNAAKGRPQQRLREKDEKGADYEEWIYGAPPEEVQFVRFTGDEVSRLTIMQVNGEKVVRTQKEMDAREIFAEAQPPKPVNSGSPSDNQNATGSATTGPGKKPTLRRPGEAEPDAQHPTVSPPPPPQTTPGSTPSPPAPRPQ